MRKKIRAKRFPSKRFHFSIVTLLLIVLPFLVGFTVFLGSNVRNSLDNRSRASGNILYTCTNSTGGKMSMADALAIAKGSECVQKGSLTSVPYCNSDTGSWWIDLKLWTDTFLCRPACVVSVATQRAEIQYRCTGASADDSSLCERTGCNKEICQDASLSERGSSCVGKPEFECYKNFASCTMQSNGHCGFTPTSQFATCMTNKACAWCGDQCASADATNCSTNIPSSTKACVYQDSRCQAVEAPCAWCGESCERNTPGKNCTKGSGVPAGLVCSPVGTGGQCSVNGLPVVPTNGPGYCDDSCQTNRDCVGWLGCYEVESGIKRCRKPQCTDEHTCFCKHTPTPPTDSLKAKVLQIIVKVTATPTITLTPTLTPHSTPSGSPILSPATVSATPIHSPTGEESGGSDIRILTHVNNQSPTGTSFTMTGIAPANSVIRISIEPDQIISTIESDAGGNWNVTFPSALESGDKEVSMIVTEPSGMELPYKTTFTIQKSVAEQSTQFRTYTFVFIGAGLLAVIVFLLFFLRRS